MSIKSKSFAVMIRALAAASGGTGVSAGSLGGFPSLSGVQITTGAVSGFPSLYQSRLHQDCATTIQCVGRFAPVPVGRLLQATNINCFGTAANNAQASFFLLTGRITNPNLFDSFVVVSEDHFRFST